MSRLHPQSSSSGSSRGPMRGESIQPTPCSWVVGTSPTMTGRGALGYVAFAESQGRPMTKRQDRDSIYVKRQFDTEIIVLCVRWYISYRLSYPSA